MEVSSPRRLSMQRLRSTAVAECARLGTRRRSLPVCAVGGVARPAEDRQYLGWHSAGSSPCARVVKAELPARVSWHLYGLTLLRIAPERTALALDLALGDRLAPRSARGQLRRNGSERTRSRRPEQHCTWAGRVDAAQ
jgi:hypothetical protein